MESQTVRLEGIVESIVFFNKSNGYIVLDLAFEDGEEPITVVGELGEVREGERILVEGEYCNHSRFGMQFRANYCEVKLPQDAADITRYLASGIIKGIGYATAKRIVDTFGHFTFNIIENEPEKLTEIKGISAKKAMQISREFRDIFNLKEVVNYLSQFKVKPSYGMKAFKRFGFETLDNIKKNPYIMCENGIDLPFSIVEEIAESCGISKNSKVRIYAGFSEVLTLANLDGHSCLPMDTFINNTIRLLKVSKNDINSDVIMSALNCEIIDYYKDANDNQYVYSMKYLNAESYIAEKIHRMCNFKSKSVKDYSQTIKKIEKNNGISYGDLQIKAINTAINSNFMILTGGPGTGKTTTLKAIIEILRLQGLKVKVTAPTGRASKRISEVTDFEATTIHRLLEVTFDESGNQRFTHNQQNTLKCDAIIVDETSMVDSLLFEALLRAVKVSCKLILVGDDDQLPSVGAGNVLKDLIQSNLVDVITLNDVFRQAQESKIIMNSHKIIHGEYPDIYTKDNDFFFLQRLTNETALQTILQLLNDRLPKTYGYTFLDDIQILSPSRKGVLGTINLNKVVQELVNPSKQGKKELKNGLYTFRIGDKVMQIKNNYDITWVKDTVKGSGIYNGDMGIIVDITSNEIEINFDGRVVIYDVELMDQLELAYAITIHKSQGSEFKAVIMPMLNNFYTLSYRNLLYTAVTRAKDLLIIVGSYKELYQMVDNNRIISRYTCLKDMIVNEFK